MLYVENTYGGDITVVDTKTFEVKSTIPVAVDKGHPDDVAGNRDGSILYCNVATETGHFHPLCCGETSWAIAYDTQYAMVDRDDDVKIGIRTSALTFGRFEVSAIMLCYAATLAILAYVGWHEGRRHWYFAGLALAALIAVYHYTLIRGRDRGLCFKAFLHNNWFGAVVFAGLAFDFVFNPMVMPPR